MAPFYSTRRTFLQAAGASVGAAVLSPPALLSRSLAVSKLGLAPQNDKPADYTLTIATEADRTCAQSHRLGHDVQRPVSRTAAAFERRRADDGRRSQRNGYAGAIALARTVGFGGCGWSGGGRDSIYSCTWEAEDFVYSAAGRDCASITPTTERERISRAGQYSGQVGPVYIEPKQ